jgi:ribosome-binding factor A
MARKGSQSFNKEKFEGRIKEELNLFLRQNMGDPRLTFVSITKVELNPDYSVAKFYYDTFDSSSVGDVTTAITGLVGKMRKHLSQKLKVRHTPTLKAIYDSQFEDEMKITQLLEATANGQEE